MQTPLAMELVPEKGEKKIPGKKLPGWVWALIGGAGLFLVFVIAGMMGGAGEELAASPATETVSLTSTITSTPARLLVLTSTVTSLPTDTFMPDETEVNNTPTPDVEAGAIMVNPVDNAEMVYVPAGYFNMGYESDCNSQDQWPIHRVYLSAYWLYQTEVTNAMYALCVQAGECSPPESTYFGLESYADHPVIYVNWYDAFDYCGWAGGRLPTEAEWEKGARGDTGWPYTWGEDTGDDFCNYGNFSCFEGTTEVGSYPAGASPYGALDMCGNVREWVQDWYNSGYYNISPIMNPSAGSGTERVIRGFSWLSNIGGYCNPCATTRRNMDPMDFDGGIGFRCVVPVEGGN
jgi:formylglycine-generating enzyme required for sulfatase activity